MRTIDLKAVVLWSVGSVLLGACGSDTTGPAPVQPDGLLWAVRLSPHLVTLATVPGYDTIQLTATPYSATDEILPSATAVVLYRKSFQSVNDTSVTVGANGIVTAHSPTPGGPVYVVAYTTVGGITLSDSTAVLVTPDVPSSPLSTLSLQLLTPNPDTPDDPDTYSVAPTPALIDCGPFSTFRVIQFYVRVVARDAKGDRIPNLMIEYTPSNPRRLQISRIGTALEFMDAGQCVDGVVGPVWLSATTTQYGVTKTDSVQLIVTPPLVSQVDVLQRTSAATGKTVSYADPSSTTIAAGGFVTWVSTRNSKTLPFDVVFDDPSAIQVVDTALLHDWIPAGPPASNANISAFQPAMEDYSAEYRTRRFPVPGRYHYRSLLNGTDGTIIVQAVAP